MATPTQNPPSSVAKEVAGDSIKTEKFVSTNFGEKPLEFEANENLISELAKQGFPIGKLSIAKA